MIKMTPELETKIKRLFDPEDLQTHIDTLQAMEDYVIRSDIDDDDAGDVLACLRDVHTLAARLRDVQMELDLCGLHDNQ